MMLDLLGVLSDNTSEKEMVFMVNSYDEAVEYISDIPRFAAKHSVEETKEFLLDLGDPSLTIPTIHVAGTNGKGSVCAFLRSCFNEKGLKVGLFTSPHLVDIRERFEIDDEMMSREEFLEIFLYIYEILQKEPYKSRGFHPSFFEYLFFMGVVWFNRRKPDVLILETGLGGRLDATNTISKPVLCIITEIGLDHMEYLGDTVDKIAYEKAGIIKPSVPLVFVDKPISGDVIRKRAKELCCDFITVSENTINNLNGTGKRIDFSLQSVYYGNANLKASIPALYQAENASLAFYGLEMITKAGIFNFSLEEIKRGIERMSWPGRMEEVYENIFLDGAHNEDGIEAFLKTVSADGAVKRRVVYSAVSDKNIEDISTDIISSGLFSDYYIAPLGGYRGADEERLVKCFSDIKNGTVHCYGDVTEAFLAMKKDITEGEKGYAVGSLYLVGKLKESI